MFSNKRPGSIVSITITLGLFILLFGECYPLHDIAAPYLLEPPDARGRSLAGGGGVYADGAIAAFYNPANLITTGAFSFHYGKSNFWAKAYDGDELKNIWISSKITDYGYYGFYCYSANYEIGTSIPEIVGLFPDYDFLMGISAALTTGKDNALGIGIKYIKTKPVIHNFGYANTIDDIKKSTIAFDIGYLTYNHFSGMTIKLSLVKMPKLRKFSRIKNNTGFAFGISLMNLGPDMNYFSFFEKDPIPRQLRVDAGYQVLESDLLATRVTIDGSKMLYDMNDNLKTEIRETTWTFGVETTVLYLLTFRAGGHLDKLGVERYGAYGFGIGPEWFHLDYSHIGHDQSGWRDGQESWSIYCNIPVDLIHP